MLLVWIVSPFLTTALSVVEVASKLWLRVNLGDEALIPDPEF